VIVSRLLSGVMVMGVGSGGGGQEAVAPQDFHTWYW